MIYQAINQTKMFIIVPQRHQKFTKNDSASVALKVTSGEQYNCNILYSYVIVNNINIIKLLHFLT